MAVSTAYELAGPPPAEQAAVVASSKTAITRKVRELRLGKSKPGPARPAQSPAGYNVRVNAPGQGHSEIAGDDAVVFLWGPARTLADAVEALGARGFRYAPSVDQVASAPPQPAPKFPLAPSPTLCQADLVSQRAGADSGADTR